jgi:mRNA interferase RelE/StbE
MAKYKIEIKRSAVKEIKKLPVKELKRVLKAIGNLADNPHPIGAIKLSSQDFYRIRIGKYRILYEIMDDVLKIIIVKVGHRKDIFN